MHALKIIWVIFLLVLTGCGSEQSTPSSTSSSGEGSGGGSSGGSSLTGTLSSIQTNIFTSKCATSGCHSASSASAGLSLAAGQSFDQLVGVTSAQLATMNRVTANDTANSYLIYKLEGTQSSVGGSGSTMPRGSSALSNAEIQAIKDWMNAGASNN